jgi:hypothetical protein
LCGFCADSIANWQFPPSCDLAHVPSLSASVNERRAVDG